MQVHYPTNPLQPGPIYFLTPRKAALFGICCEAIPRQVNFIIDEASDTGKGANTVVSMLDYFFDHHGLGETTVILHADNCCGQNKNNTMMQYLMWRAMTGLHHSITISFLNRWPHQVCSRRLLWIAEERVPEDRGQQPSRSRAGGSVLGDCERVTANRQPDWGIHRSDEGLGRLPWTTVSAIDGDKAIPSLPL